ncbi:hypothetical protein PMAYCL1PPCAC_28492 [Pristionchus mayeri]|uniref:Protein arginine N-methyltransferase domain-containing protein n=1 Tax=Pristionchus mayeri TaxID=1317129 RepID=A0AAN5D9R6_9BILA|nr:hypothetical protein PMAYCL1PPCAC_28492 [Pristionchus mayeri]
MSSIRKVAITEPLVDAVRSNRVMANSYCVKEIDLYTVQILDLAWTSDFMLRMRRDDCVQDALIVKKGEELKGVFTCATWTSRLKYPSTVRFAISRRRTPIPCIKLLFTQIFLSFPLVPELFVVFGCTLNWISDVSVSTHSRVVC